MDEQEERMENSRLGRKVNKLDVDEFGNAAGKYPRARVEIPIEKPLKRYITLETSRGDVFYDLQYEKLPFFCFACGVIGHSELECPNPSERDANGKWEYDNLLREPEERKKKLQSFAQAAAASDWSGSSNRSDTHLCSKERSSEELNSQEPEERKDTLEVFTSPTEMQDPHIFYQDILSLGRKQKPMKSSTLHQQQAEVLTEKTHMLENTGSLALIPSQEYVRSMRESFPSALVEFDQNNVEGAKKQKMETSSSFLLSAEAACDEQPRRSP